MYDDCFKTVVFNLFDKSYYFCIRQKHLTYSVYTSTQYSVYKEYENVHRLHFLKEYK